MEHVFVYALQCRGSLVLPAWCALLADGQMGATKAGHGTAVTLHPASCAFATVIA